MTSTVMAKEIIKDKFILTRSIRFIFLSLRNQKSREGSVGIANGYRLDDQGIGVHVLVESRILSSPYRPDRL
jgi:hypothetical protein